MSRRPFPPRSATAGRPDKVAGRTGDTLPDPLPQARPAPGAAPGPRVTTGLVHAACEVSSTSYAPNAQLVRDKILEIGHGTGRTDAEGCPDAGPAGGRVRAVARSADTSRTPACCHCFGGLPDFTWERAGRAGHPAAAAGLAA
ncbi:hypothetical protein [Streptomyces genisteinicus]|uniref:Uncharacterized protein n=1 Tax=Streptomyces genisteinicus TaxID=2768068 RepID=A0A7H0I524_9ACTN|nr:hypothetical protein [Streptomyces genisteinicus]QNP67890.1 hypothetical protein IAG43_33660 [Streptomyces genisteinicus]